MRFFGHVMATERLEILTGKVEGRGKVERPATWCRKYIRDGTRLGQLAAL